MRLVCLVDGFNLYYSIKDAIKHGGADSLRWLDVRRLCESQLHAFGDKTARFEEYYYFTSLLTQCDKDVRDRQGRYNKLQAEMGFDIVLGSFLQRDAECKNCRKRYGFYAEKQTDVKIASRLVASMCSGFDGALFVSGDGDLAGAVKTVNEMFPKKGPTGKKIMVALPYNKKHTDLTTEAWGSLKLTAADYENHVMPEKITVNGIVHKMPDYWKTGRK